MVNMQILNEAEILNNIRERYSVDNIFTYIGPTLVVMNPYKKLEENFSADTTGKVLDLLRKNGDFFQINMTAPHIFAISANAFKQLNTN